ncbi:hypothetical protein FGO68_gene10683 [Halteria grandinella]|uniref:Histidine kinase n=1 Tax=Halteria grandinella TaxID=5974 RepID=A0A8J8P4R3_HALGN|nr:hypothetical protein FGO68_gene10683 [Halteria grandinella]
MVLGFLFMCIFSRAYSQRERRRFKEEKQQSLILQMLGGLVKNHHDGIVATVGERIILRNSRVSQIFESNSPEKIIDIPNQHDSTIREQKQNGNYSLEKIALPEEFDRKQSRNKSLNSSENFNARDDNQRDKRIISSLKNTFCTSDDGNFSLNINPSDPRTLCSPSNPGAYTHNHDENNEQNVLSTSANGNVSIWEFIQQQEKQKCELSNLFDQRKEECKEAPESLQYRSVQSVGKNEEDIEEGKYEQTNGKKLLKSFNVRKSLYFSQNSNNQRNKISVKKKSEGLQFQIIKSLDKGEDLDQKQKQLQVFTQVVAMGSEKVVITTIRDMSQWLELERQRNITNTQTVAFASAAHEFRNPLNAINASLELLKPKIDLSQESQLYYQIAKSCSNLMLFLVKDILDFAQMESKSLILNKELTNVIILIKECLEALSFKAQEKGLSLSANSFGVSSLQILTVPNRVMQILINLLSNAVKYTQCGHVAVDVAKDELEGVLKIIVEDSGVGMSHEQVDKLFKPYTKIMSNRNMNKEGVGLGLAVSRNIARALGGDITVESKEGKGSRFTLILPYSRPTSLDTQINNQAIQEQNETQFTLNSEHEQEVQFPYQDWNDSYILPSALRAMNTSQAPHTQQALLEPSDSLTIHKQDVTPNASPSPQQLINCNSLQVNSCNCPQILIADDERFNNIVLEGFIEKNGCGRVDTATNGEQALKQVLANAKGEANQYCKSGSKHRPYQFVFLDYHMPIMDGVQAAKRIRQLQTAGEIPNTTQLVLVTGDSIANDSYLRRLFDKILCKPVNSEDIKKILSAIK